MPAFRSMEALAAAYPPFNQNPEGNVYHRVFCFWCRELMGSEYTCWAAIQQFKANPNKRMAIFIVETWLKPTSGGVGASKNQSILDPINTGSAGSGFSQKKRDATIETITGMKSVKTLKGKLANWSDRAELGHVDAQTLADVELVLQENFFDVFAKQSFQTEREMQGSPFYAASLRTDVPKLAAVPFFTDIMGLW